MPLLRDQIDLERARLKRLRFEISGSSGAIEDVTGCSALFVARLPGTMPSGSVWTDTGSEVIFTRSTISGCGITPSASGFLVEFTKAITASLTLNQPDGGDYVYEMAYIPQGETDPVMIATGTLWIVPNYARGL